jgi:hypothetical protein
LLKGNAKAGMIAREFLSIRPQADLVQQGAAADRKELVFHSSTWMVVLLSPGS